MVYDFFPGQGLWYIILVQAKTYLFKLHQSWFAYFDL